MRNGEFLALEEGPPGPMLNHAIEGERAWTRESLAPADWTVPIPPQATGEIRALIHALRSDPLPTLVLTPEMFELDACRTMMNRVRGILREGIGLCVVDRLPLDEMSAEEAESVYWVLGQLVERPVAQKWDGTMIYNVTDTGHKHEYGVRGSWTNVELFFHTDNCFAVAPPEYVSLLCLRPAIEGGISRFCSLYTVHNRMLEKHPHLLKRLYEPFYFDRQAEHAPGEPKVSFSPAFRHDRSRLKVRISDHLIRNGYALMGEELDAQGREALDALREILADPSLWVEFTIQRGQLQYLNNSEFAHFRSEFTDHDDPACKRHLIRLWYRGHGRRSYDG